MNRRSFLTLPLGFTLTAPDDLAVTDRMWIDAARTRFRGRIVLGKDLLEV